MLSLAAFNEGRHAQAFPSFGSERTGAPVVAYCRIDERPIRTREPIDRPDALIVLDPTLLAQVDILTGLPADAFVLVNSTKDPADLGLEDFLSSHRRERLLTVPATDIALRRIGRPVPNVALLGGFAAMTGLVELESVGAAARQRFPGEIGHHNAAAAAEAFEYVTAEQADLAQPVPRPAGAGTDRATRQQESMADQS